MNNSGLYIKWFKNISLRDISIVGGKNASLGDMYSNLSKKGINIPNGFATTSEAFRGFLEHNNIAHSLRDTLSDIKRSDVAQISSKAKKARDLIMSSCIPDVIWTDISKAYDELCRQYGNNTDVAVRSSATAEDLPAASFAGQQETYLNIRGHNSLKEACLKCFASLYTDRAITYRMDHNFDQFKIALSIGIQKMVRSDLASSGVMFTLDTDSGFRDVIFITASYGLGENIVQGTVNPDEYYVFKPTLKKGFSPIIRKLLGEKKIKMVYSLDDAKTSVRNVEVPISDRGKYCLSDEEILTLARYAATIEEYYTAVSKKPQYKDIEWAKDGITGKLFILQSRPETVQSLKSQDVLENYLLDRKGKVLVQGKSVGNRIGTGPARLVKDASQLKNFKPGEVLVSNSTTPDWEPVMKTAGAIVTNRGGRTCHAAIVSRELGIPAVVGTLNATEVLKTGQDVTVCCSEGDKGIVYDGILKFRVVSVALKDIKRPRTKIMINIANPDIAFTTSMIPNDGVGLARMEFIISSHIKIHPLAIIKPDKVTDKEIKKQINDLTSNYRDKTKYFVEKLSEGTGTIAAAFYPKPVIVRMSDFKSNEYANLIGGKYFEVPEENPMIGFRGASRYYDNRYREGFALECKAIKRVREEFGLTNLIVMIPFCRTVTEGKKVLDEMAKNGLKRGQNGLEIYIMCEIPNNVLMIDEFSKLFDGFSIGSNDLTQLVLGVDRDSELIAHNYDERNMGVYKMLAMAIQGAKKSARHIGICGQAPSDYPEFADFLVKEGINAISLNPDSVINTTIHILETEKKLKNKKRSH